MRAGVLLSDFGVGGVATVGGAPCLTSSEPGPNIRRSSRPLARYLDEARAILTARPESTAPPAAVSERYDRLRWFELPHTCLSTAVSMGSR